MYLPVWTQKKNTVKKKSKFPHCPQMYILHFYVTQFAHPHISNIYYSKFGWWQQLKYEQIGRAKIAFLLQKKCNISLIILMNMLQQFAMPETCNTRNLLYPQSPWSWQYYSLYNYKSAHASQNACWFSLILWFTHEFLHMKAPGHQLECFSRKTDLIVHKYHVL